MYIYAGDILEGLVISLLNSNNYCRLVLIESLLWEQLLIWCAKIMWIKINLTNTISVVIIKLNYVEFNVSCLYISFSIFAKAFCTQTHTILSKREPYYFHVSAAESKRWAYSKQLMELLERISFSRISQKRAQRGWDAGKAGTAFSKAHAINAVRFGPVCSLISCRTIIINVFLAYINSSKIYSLTPCSCFVYFEYVFNIKI